MKKLWIITDTHFGHKKIVQLCNRPPDYEEKLLASMLTIPETDCLIHLGDILIGHDAPIHETFIRPIPCQKILVKGNHDSKSDSWYMDHGWDFVVRSMVVKSVGHYVHLSHQPIPKWHLLANSYNLHGHFHNNEDREREFADGANQSNYDPDVHLRLAVEYTNYQALPLDHIIEHPEKFRIKPRG